MGRQRHRASTRKWEGASGGRNACATEGIILASQTRKVSRVNPTESADSAAVVATKRQSRKRSTTENAGILEASSAKKKQRTGVKDTKRNPRNASDGGTANSEGFAGCDTREGNSREAHDVSGSTARRQASGASSAGRGQFLQKLQGRLSGGRFRMLNETLYTSSGEEAYEFFQRDPSAFSVYHSGYRDQMARWPIQPVEVVIGWLKARSAKLVVADFGCGDAKLAKSVRNKVFSLDLASSDPCVIVGNMANSPLHTNSIDVAVFSLSLMGTDYPSFIREAARVLKSGGSLVIAEVKSRFEGKNGEAILEQFIACLESSGFVLVSHDASNKMFIMLYLHKRSTSKDFRDNSKNWPALKACFYKRR